MLNILFYKCIPTLSHTITQIIHKIVFTTMIFTYTNQWAYYTKYYIHTGTLFKLKSSLLALLTDIVIQTKAFILKLHENG